MNTLLSYLSFIPYFFYLFLLIKDELVNEKNGKDLFRFDTLILVAVFIFFASYKVPLVCKMLFATINLYLFVNKIYDHDLKNKKIKKKDYLKIVFVYVIALLLILPYILFKKLTFCYYLAFIMILMIHFIVWFAKKICR